MIYAIFCLESLLANLVWRMVANILIILGIIMKFWPKVYIESFWMKFMSISCCSFASGSSYFRGSWLIQNWKTFWKLGICLLKVAMIFPSEAMILSRQNWKSFCLLELLLDVV